MYGAVLYWATLSCAVCPWGYKADMSCPLRCPIRHTLLRAHAWRIRHDTSVFTPLAGVSVGFDPLPKMLTLPWHLPRHWGHVFLLWTGSQGAMLRNHHLNITVQLLVRHHQFSHLEPWLNVSQSSSLGPAWPACPLYILGPSVICVAWTSTALHRTQTYNLGHGRQAW